MTSAARTRTTSRSDAVPVFVVDTREQQPYMFDPERISTVRGALPAGDYSLAGLETAIAAERKTLDDYVTSVIIGRERFMREVQLLATYDRACIVVEASFSDVVEHRYRAGVHPNAVQGATWAIAVDHGVPVYFLGDRQLACRFVEGFLLRYHKKANDE
jgi:DNA excision repair protein ERCC-4